MDLQQAENLYARAVYAYQSKNIDKAINLWSEIENTPSLNDIYEDAQVQLGICYRGKGLIDKAIEYWEKIKHQDYIQHAYINLGSAFAEKELFDDAIFYWKKVDKNNPLYENILLDIATVLIRKNEKKEAENYLLGILHKNSITYDRAQYELANIYYQRGEIENSISCYEKISNSDQNLFSISKFNLAAIYQEISDLENAVKNWKKIKLCHKKLYSTAQYNLGVFHSDKEEYKEAIAYWSKISLDIEEDYESAQFALGLTYLKLNKLEQAREYWKNVPASCSDNYAKAQYHLGHIHLPSETIIEKLENRINYWAKIPSQHILHDYIYYRLSICKKIIDSKNIIYKDIFFQLSDTINNLLNLLNVNSEFERLIAHYTNITVSKLLLSNSQNSSKYKEKSPLRLNTVNLMNDPEEGMLINKLLCLDSEIHTKELAFISCFTLHYDSLNQFRLYAKENNQEAMGLSLVLNKDFFEEYCNLSKMFSTTQILRNDKNEFEGKLESETVYNTKLSRSPLYRCIYLDPTSGLIKVAQREEWSFHREYKKQNKAYMLESNTEAEQNWQDYQAEILKIESQVTIYLKEIVEHIKLLNPKDLNDEEKELLAEILLPLRYLIKHMAFKEEQECRMIYVTQMDNPLIKYDEKINRIYIDYEPSVMEHLEKIYLAPKAKGERMVFEYLCSRGQEVRKGKAPVRLKLSQNPFQ